MTTKSLSAPLRMAAILVVLALAAGAALVPYLGSRRLAVATERFEAEVGPLDALVHAPGDVPEADNAAAWLRSGAAALELTPEEWADLDDFLAGPADAPADAIESLLARHAAALADLRRAGGLDRSSFGADYRAGPDSLPADELSGQLRARGVLAADARLALATGDRARFLADLRAVAAQHRALLREPAFIFQIIGRAVEAGFHDLVQDLLVSETADPALLAAAAAELDAGDPQASLAAAFAVEAWWMRDASETAPGGIVERLARPYVAADAIDLYRRLCRAAELPATEIEAFVTLVPGTVAEMLIPNLVDALLKHRASAAARRLAGTAVKLRLHGLATGTYPETLEEIPGIRAGDFEDPYAGGAIRYRRLEDDSAELSFPEAEALWSGQQPNWRQHRHQPRFVWRLPAKVPSRL